MITMSVRKDLFRKSKLLEIRNSQHQARCRGSGRKSLIFNMLRTFFHCRDMALVR